MDKQVLAEDALELSRQRLKGAARADVLAVGLELDAAEAELEGTREHQQLGLDVGVGAPLAARVPSHADLDAAILGIDGVKAGATDGHTVAAANGGGGGAWVAPGALSGTG